MHAIDHELHTQSLHLAEERIADARSFPLHPNEAARKIMKMIHDFAGPSHVEPGRFGAGVLIIDGDEGDRVATAFVPDPTGIEYADLVHEGLHTYVMRGNPALRKLPFDRATTISRFYTYPTGNPETPLAAVGGVALDGSDVEAVRDLSVELPSIVFCVKPKPQESSRGNEANVLRIHQGQVEAGESYPLSA